MKTLTKILGIIAIAGALVGFAGYGTKNQTALAAGATGLLVGGVGYIIAKSKEDDTKFNYK